MTEAVDIARAAIRRAVLASAGQDPGAPLSPPPEGYRAIEADEARLGLEAVIVGPAPERGLERLREEGALDALLPEVAALVGFGEGDRRHKDVWDHTKRVVRQSPTRTELRWAALLHDIGKVHTRRSGPGGQVTFHGHAELGARMAARVMRRLAFDEELAVRVRRLVLFHLRANQYDPGWSESAVRRFGREIGDLLPDLLDLSRADMTTKYTDKRQRGLEQIDELEQRVAAVRELDAREPPLPKGFGSMIVERFGLRPGPTVGVYRNSAELAIEAGVLDPREDPEVYLGWLEQRRAGLEAAAAGEGPGVRGEPRAYLKWLEHGRTRP